jgi:dihydroxy-acid dehydratase
MSGTHYGSCIVHAAPEAAVGGPIALVKDGDWITLDVSAGRLDVEVSDAELAERRKHWRAPARFTERGFTRLYVDHVTQADKGCDFDFLMGNAKTPEPPIY